MSVSKPRLSANRLRQAATAACLLAILAAPAWASDEKPRGPSATPTPALKHSPTGPKTYPISSIFIESDATPTPTPTPVPPPGARVAPDLTPLKPGEKLPAPPKPGSGKDAATTATLRATPTPAPPTPTPAPTAAPTPPAPPSVKNPLDLNAATAEQLVQLEGIDHWRAELILSHRRALGGFTTLRQLRDVFGVSEKLFRNLTPLVTVAPRRKTRDGAAPKPPAVVETRLNLPVPAQAVKKKTTPKPASGDAKTSPSKPATPPPPPTP